MGGCHQDDGDQNRLGLGLFPIEVADDRHVRFTPESGHWLSVLGCPLCAKSRHRSKELVHNKCVHIALRWMLERGWQAPNDVEP